MKVKIGKYPTHLVCNIHTNYMTRKHGFDFPDNTTQFEQFLENVEDIVQDYIYNPINKHYFFKQERKVRVRINPSDTWSMDNTLAHIIAPMLVQLKEDKHGSPFVDNEDVPEELRCSEEDQNKCEQFGYTDKNFHKRWDWVMDEMIFAFTFIRDNDILDLEEDDRDEVSKRVQNGTKLFGKYYQALWD